MDECTIAYVGLGSNQGDRLDHLHSAIMGLDEDSYVDVRRTSPVYETEAHTMSPSEDQPPFLNAVVELEVGCDPIRLLDVAQSVEEGEGRDRESGTTWGPRSLDVDLLVVGDVTCDTDRLTLPHPRLSERAFVLRPWADIAPNLHVPPPFDASVERLLEACPDRHGIRRTSHTLRLPETRGAEEGEEESGR